VVEALGITGTLIAFLYYLRKQTGSLALDIETKVLNHLDERIYSHSKNR
jgi:hypothetical protein